jgi:hypothetical protein
VAPLVEASEEVETLGEVQVGAEVVRLEAGAEQAMEEAEEVHHVEEARAVTVVVAVVVAVVVQDKTEAEMGFVAVEGALADVGSVAARVSMCRTNARHRGRPDIELCK